MYCRTYRITKANKRYAAPLSVSLNADWMVTLTRSVDHLSSSLVISGQCSQCLLSTDVMRAIFLFPCLSNSPAAVVSDTPLCAQGLLRVLCFSFCVCAHIVLEPLGTHQKPVTKLTIVCAQQKESHVFLIPSSAHKYPAPQQIVCL